MTKIITQILACLTIILTISFASPTSAYADDTDTEITSSATDLTLNQGKLSCWSCDAELYGIKFIQSSATLPTAIQGVVFPTFVGIIGISILLSFISAFAAGTANAHNEAISLTWRLMIFGVIFSIPGGVTAIAEDILLKPSMQIGAYFSDKLSTNVGNKIQAEVPITECPSETTSSIGITDPELIDIANILVTNTCQVHQALTTIWVIGSGIATEKGREGTIYDTMVSKLYNSIGTLIMFSTYATIVDYALSVFEILLRVGVFLAVSPFLGLYWVVPSMRGSIRTVFSTLINLMLTIMVSGVTAPLTVYVVLVCISAGINGGNGDILSPAAIVSEFHELTANGATLSSTGMMKLVNLCAMTLIGSSMALAMNRSIQDLMMTISQYESGGSAHTLADAAMSGFSGAANVGKNTAGILGTAIANPIAKKIGSKL